MSTRLERRVVAKIGNYAINPTLDRPGTVFTNRGAGVGITFTLPKANRALTGWWYRFKGIANFSVTVTGISADQLIAFNDALATSVGAITAGMLIGAEMEAFCDGTGWSVIGISAGVTFTVTA